jgi:hypothetical protein
VSLSHSLVSTTSSGSPPLEPVAPPSFVEPLLVPASPNVNFLPPDELLLVLDLPTGVAFVTGPGSSTTAPLLQATKTTTIAQPNVPKRFHRIPSV